MFLKHDTVIALKICYLFMLNSGLFFKFIFQFGYFAGYEHVKGESVDGMQNEAYIGENQTK